MPAERSVLRRCRPTVPLLLVVGAVWAVLTVGCGALLGVEDVPDFPVDGGAASDGAEASSPDAPSGAEIPPSSAPSKATFRDQDPRASFVAGDVVVSPGAAAEGVTEYRVYWGATATSRIGGQPIGTAAATPAGGTATLGPALAVPDGAAYLLVYAANAKGEAPVGVSAPLRDNYARYVDISGTLDYTHNYALPSAAISLARKELYVVSEAQSTGGYNNLVRCALDGTSCVRTTLPTSALTHATLFVDEPGAKLMFTGMNTGDGGPGGSAAFVRCNLDGAGCVSYPASSFAPDPSAAVDATHKKIYLFFSSPSAHPAMTICNFDGTGCVNNLLDGVGSPRTGVIDIQGSRVLMVDNAPLLYASGLAGESPVSTNIGGGAPAKSAEDPVAILDSKSQKIVVAARNNANGDRVSLFRCDLTGANCKFIDASAGQPGGSGKAPSIALDTVRDKIYVATQNATDRPSLFRCNSDGTACAHVDIAAGQPGSSGVAPKVLIDTINDRVLVVTQVVSGTDSSVDLRAGLFALDLW